MAKITDVSITLNNEKIKVGELSSKDSNTLTFTYDSNWLSNPNFYYINPNHTENSYDIDNCKNSANAVTDSLPDYYTFNEFYNARNKNQPSNTLSNINDYLYDMIKNSYNDIRIGNIEFSIANDRMDSSSILIGELPLLNKANIDFNSAINYTDKFNVDISRIYPYVITFNGYSNKISMYYNGNYQYLVKFMSNSNDYSNITEFINIKIAEIAGIKVQPAELYIDSDSNSYLYMVKRFDVDNNNKLPVITMKTYCNYSSSNNGIMLTNIIDNINKNGNKDDIKELYKQLLFRYKTKTYNSKLYSNMSMIYYNKCWNLAPLYDVNYVISNSDKISNSVIENLASSYRELFGISVDENEQINKQIDDAISKKTDIIRQYNIPEKIVNSL